MSAPAACVYGLGRTGLSFVRHYRARGWDVRVGDAAAAPAGLPRLRAEFPGLRCARLADAAALARHAAGCAEVAVSPGVPPDRLPAGLPVTGDLDLFLAAFRDRWPTASPRPRLAAVTGTNGKSTVASLLATLVSTPAAPAQAVGNIGVPLLDALAGWERAGWPAHVVAELSSFQLAGGKRELAADVAILLNITADHLDWHGGWDGYVAAKSRVYAQAAIGIFDEAGATAGLAGVARRRIGFCSTGPARDPAGWGVAGTHLVGPAGLVGPAASGLLAAGIMPAAAAAALTAAKALCPAQDVAAHLARLTYARGLDHRLQCVGTVAGIDFIDDSKATNVAAACQALASLPGTTVPVFGGQGKGQDFAPLGAAATAAHVPVALVLGAPPPGMRAALAAHGVPTQPAASMRAAVRQGRQLAQAHGARRVLLSPACASFDRYADFTARGRDFAAEVDRL